MKMVSCAGCDQPIKERYLDKVLDQTWHTYCVRCYDCKGKLTGKCFSRDGKLFCKNDFFKRFGTKCAGCSQGILPEDYVRWARNKVYHVACLTCMDCHKELSTGDELYILDDNIILCKSDYLTSRYHSQANDEPMQSDLTMTPPDMSSVSQPELSVSQSDHMTVTQSDLTTVPGTDITVSSGPPSDLTDSSRRHHQRDSVRPSVHKQNSEHKPTRVRTVLNEKQLTTLRTCYNANPRPDALLKERLVEMTGLSARVIRVWFQNKRCKDKKKQIMMKQIQQQEKFVFSDSMTSDFEYTPQSSPDGRQLQSIANMQGVPLVATSPVQHEIPHPIEVQSYHPPWKSLADYTQLPPDCDPNDPSMSQHLDGQVGETVFTY